ncbi:MAG: ABC transporter permease [Oscillospiraceae bacterium]
MTETLVLTLTTYLASALRLATPLTLAGLGEAYSERSGVINIGLEGIMLTGAFTAFMVNVWTQNLFLGMLAGALGGMAVSLLHALLSIQCRANQTITGLALNFLALGLTSFLFLKAFGQASTLPLCTTVAPIAIPGLSKIPVLGGILFTQNIYVYMMVIAIVVLTILFEKTEWGVNLTAVGEHPRAADTAGISVYGTRYFACAVNGLFGGLAGSYMTLAQMGFFQENITAGQGYMALVAVILGRRNPVKILIASLAIGFAQALQFNLQTMGLGIPSQVFSMIPYVVAVLVLLFSIGRSSDPAALGVPYERNNR